MKKIVIEQNPSAQGGAYLKIEGGKILLGLWGGDHESVMILAPHDVAGIRAFLNGVTAYTVDGALLPRPWHVRGNVQAIRDHV